MTSRFLSVLKFSVLLAAVLLGGIGVLWVADVFTGESARDYAVKALAILGVFTAAMLVIAALGGGSRKGGSGAPPGQQ